MRITHDYHEFIVETGWVFDFIRAKELGLATDDISATFWPDEMDDVFHFCECNPSFHIVSNLGKGIYINRYDPRGIMFQVAEGDADPHYMLDIRHMHEWMFPSVHGF